MRDAGLFCAMYLLLRRLLAVVLAGRLGARVRGLLGIKGLRRGDGLAGAAWVYTFCSSKPKARLASLDTRGSPASCSLTTLVMAMMQNTRIIRETSR